MMLRLQILTAAACLLTLLTVPSQISAGAFDPNAPYPYLTTDTFTSIKNTPAERLVLFFHSSPTAASTLTILNTAARRLRTELPNFLFQYCNGSLPANSGDFAAAGFTSGEWLFTSTPGEGIVKYGGPVTVVDVVEHVRHKYLAANGADLVRFTTEDAFYGLLDAPPALPIFVKFFEPWCEHCKRLAPTFAISATYFRSAVRHVEVQCSGAPDETEFCKRHGINSYPVVMLFDGERSVKYEGEERSVRAFDAFFEQNVAGYESRVKALRKEKAEKKRKQRAAGGAAVDEDDAAASAGLDTVKNAKEAEAEERAIKSKAEQAKVLARREKKAASQRADKQATPTEIAAQPETSVADRLSALEKEVGEMHSTLRAVQQQLTLLVAQKR